MPPVDIVEIDDPLVPSVCEFLERSIGRGMSAADFSTVFARRWADGPPGFVLLAGTEVVGALATIRSGRTIGGRVRDVCNLSSWAIAPAFRTYAPALLRRAVASDDTVYTNFTASSAVVELLHAFGFVALPDHERVLLPFAAQPRSQAPATGADAVADFVKHDPAAVRVIVDHRDSRAQFVGVEADGERCAFALHLMRVRAIPFAHVLYSSAPPHRFSASVRALRRALPRAWGFRLISWSEWQFGRGATSIGVRRPRPVMIKGVDIVPAQLDALYSELALLPILA